MTVQNTRVLIVEDDYLVSEMVRGMSEEIGYTVVGEAASGLEAIEAVQSLRPDAVVMDIRMPDMDGIEATRLIQEQCPAPVVVLSAYETRDLLEQASEAGVGAYLVKPPNAHDLERAIYIAMARFEDTMNLRRLNQDLRTRNEELDAFSHTVAHDLKNPLSVIIGLAEVLRSCYSTMSEEELDECLWTLDQTARDINRITDQLLVLAKARRTEVAMESLDMSSIVSKACRRLANFIDAYQAEIVLPDEWPVALGYGPWIEEVWVNYINNAIKHGGRPPRVELGAIEQPDGMVRFWIRDNGSGISAEDQGRLFEPFTRLDGDAVEGYGLGLSIVRRIVEKLGGQVGTQSEEGRGSMFSFTLPSRLSQQVT